MAEISADDLRRKIKDGEDILIVDVRTEEEFKSGSLSLAINLPLDELRRDPSLSGLKINPERQIICVCRSGMRSGEAARLLEKAGCRNVKNLEGGLLAWNPQKERGCEGDRI
ncbi:MAG: rhodanese-like domain-containing protein [Parcubacteria group bacterium]|nr:rhodanese-like domain-containing protein [Parcubacteria group bacterium]